MQTPPPAKEVLDKTLTSYVTATSYQATWSFTSQMGALSQKMGIEIRYKAPAMLVFRMGGGKQKPSKGLPPIPELEVVIDGKTAHFVNASENVYYDVPLPKNPHVTPIMFLPLITVPTTADVTFGRLPDGKPILTLKSTAQDGTVSRLEVDWQTYHIRHLVSERTVGAGQVSSTLAVEKEVFGADMPDREFTFKPPHGAKEVPAPDTARSLFGTQ